jgi:hypothetical protein
MIFYGGHDALLSGVAQAARPWACSHQAWMNARRMAGSKPHASLGSPNLNRAAVRLLFAIPALLACVLPAPADTAAEVTRRWGLIGSWATDCSAPPSKARPVLSYDITGDGRVMHRRDFGTGTDEQEVVAAKILADGMLSIRIHFPAFKQTRENGIARQPDGSIRSIFSRNERNEYSVRNGKFVANGNPTSVLRKCIPGA